MGYKKKNHLFMFLNSKTLIFSLLLCSLAHTWVQEDNTNIIRYLQVATKRYNWCTCPNFKTAYAVLSEDHCRGLDNVFMKNLSVADVKKRRPKAIVNDEQMGRFVYCTSSMASNKCKSFKTALCELNNKLIIQYGKKFSNFGRRLELDDNCECNERRLQKSVKKAKLDKKNSVDAAVLKLLARRSQIQTNLKICLKPKKSIRFKKKKIKKLVLKGKKKKKAKKTKKSKKAGKKAKKGLKLKITVKKSKN